MGNRVQLGERKQISICSKMDRITLNCVHEQLSLGSCSENMSIWLGRRLNRQTRTMPEPDPTILDSFLAFHLSKFPTEQRSRVHSQSGFWWILVSQTLPGQTNFKKPRPLRNKLKCFRTKTNLSRTLFGQKNPGRNQTQLTERTKRRRSAAQGRNRNRKFDQITKATQHS